MIKKYQTSTLNFFQTLAVDQYKILINALKSRIVLAVSLILLFLTLRALKFLVFLYSISAPLLPSKFLFLLLTGYTIYFLILRSRKALIIVLILEDLWILLNSIYFLYFDNYFHILNFLFHLTTNFSNAKEGISFLSAVSVIGWVSRLLIILIDLPIFLVLLNTNIFSKVKEVIKQKASKRVWILCVTALLLSEFFFTTRNDGIYNITSKMLKEGLSLKEEKKAISRYGTLFLNILDLLYLLDDKLAYKIVERGREIVFTGSYPRRNVIVIQVESLDSSVVFTDYKGQPVTPFLRSLAEECIFFPIVVSYHFAGYTSDAEFAVLTSLHPLKDIPSIRYWRNYNNSIVKVLKSNNYVAYAFHNNKGTFFGRKDAYKRMGFDKLFDITEMGLEEKGWGASDEDVFNFARNFIKKLKNTNFFAFIITMSTHGPFTFTEKYYTNELFNDIEDSTTRRYFNSMSYIDKVLSNFVDFVRSNFSNTSVIIYGDHHSSVQNSSYYKRSVAFVDEGKIIEIVPLFIIDPEIESKKFITPVSQIDISPTILYLCRAKGKIISKGEVLLPSPKSKTVFYLGEKVEKEKILKGLNFSPYY
ncbi:MAG: sulfatase-like hydrolase/transferase [Brevinematia bacterium]